MLLFLIVCLYLVFFFVSLIPKMHTEFKRVESEELLSRMSRCMTYIQRGFRRTLKLCKIKLTVLGQEQLSYDSPILYVSNHRSFLDIISSFTLFSRPIGFLGKKELQKIPLLRSWMLLTGSVFVDRNNPKEALKSIQKAKEYVDSGLSIWVFPEGTRGNDPNELNLSEFKAGSLKIALKTSCPIIPVAISHSDRVWERQFPHIIPKQHIIIKFGKAIQTKDLDLSERKNLPTMLQDKVKDLLREIQEIRKHAQEEI